MNNILNSGFSRLSPEDLAAAAFSIILALTGNPNFLTTDPTLAAVQALLDALNQAIGMPKGPARDQAIRATRKALEQGLADLAANLEDTADDNLVKLATTGFELRKPNAQTGEPPATPQALYLKMTTTSGEVQVLFEASDRAKTYQVQTALDPNAGPWVDYDLFSSSRRITLKGQPRAKDLWVRVRAIGPNNTKSGWSDPATILVS